MCLMMVALVFRVRTPSKERRHYKPPSLFGVPIAEEFRVPWFRSVDDVIGRIHRGYATEIADEIVTALLEG
jgi:hypothetical protein